MKLLQFFILYSHLVVRFYWSCGYRGRNGGEKSLISFTRKFISNGY